MNILQAIEELEKGKEIYNWILGERWRKIDGEYYTWEVEPWGTKKIWRHKYELCLTPKAIASTRWMVRDD